MQNNNNFQIADELDAISIKINELDKSNVSDSIAKIHTSYREIEQIARQYELTTLLAIVDWVDLSTELDDENSEQIETLLTTDAYSNWIDVIVSLLKDYNDNLRAIIHQSLTSPKWVIKPSTILLKDIAKWIASIKIEHEATPKPQNDTQENTLFDDNETEETIELIDSDIDISSEQSESNKIIENQLLKAEEADDEAMLQQNVFMEVDQDILEKDYTTSEITEEFIENNSEESLIPLVETEKSSIDDDNFETVYSNPSDPYTLESDRSITDSLLTQNNLLNDSIETNDSNTFDDMNFETELLNIHTALKTINVTSNDVFSSKDSFRKHLDHLTLVTQDTNFKSVVPIVEWCKRNLILFQDNTTPSIEQFISSGKVWTWIEKLSMCLKSNDKSECLDGLTTSLTQNSWLEPLLTEELESLLIDVNGVVSGELISSEEIKESNLDSDITEEIFDTSNDGMDNKLPELLDDPIVIDSPSDEESDDLLDASIEVSGLQMTWDDDTHPELLMVYLEETPLQVEELKPLLVKISDNKADINDKETAARLAHTIKGGSAVVGITALADLAGHLETLLDYSVTSQLSSEVLNKLPEVGNSIDKTFKAIELQGEEPAEFMTSFKLLEEYDYDQEIADTNKLNETAEFTVDDSSDDTSVDFSHNESALINETDLIEDETIDVETTEQVITLDESLKTNDLNETDTLSEVTTIETDLIEVETEEVEAINQVFTLDENLEEDDVTEEIALSEDTITETDLIVDNTEKVDVTNHVFTLDESDETDVINEEDIMSEITESNEEFTKDRDVDDSLTIDETNNITEDKELDISMIATASVAATALIGNEIINNDKDDRTKNNDEIKIESEAIFSEDDSIEEDMTTQIVTEKSGFKMTWDDDTHPELLMVYLEETPTQINELVPLLHKISENKADDEEKHTASRMAHTIKGGSAIVGLTTLSEISYRLETLLDHSVKHQLPNEILETLPKTATCIEELFDAVQMQEEEPAEYFGIFKTLDTFVESIDDLEDETLELSSVTLPDFIVNQNNDTDTSIVIDKEEQNADTDYKQEEEITSKTDEVEELVISEDTSAEIEDDIKSDEKELDTETLVDIEEEVSSETKIEVIETDEVYDSIDSDDTFVEIENDVQEQSSGNTAIAAAASLAAAALIGNGINKKEDAEPTEITVDASVESEDESFEKSDFKMTWDDDTHPELLMVYLEETPTQINELVPLLNKISENKADGDEKHTASRMAHTIKGGSAIVGLTTLSEISYRLETLLDHSVKHQLPNEILEILPKTGTCLENLFDAVQMQEEEPNEYFSIFKQLDSYVNTIDDNDEEVLELSSVALPDFIVNQNKKEDSNTLKDTKEVVSETTKNDTKDEATELDIDSVEDESINTEVAETEEKQSDAEKSDIEIEDDKEVAEVSEDKSLESTIDEIESTDSENIETTTEAEEISAEKTEIESETEVENEVKKSVAVDAVKLDKLKTEEDVDNILVEIDDIVLNLISHGSLSNKPAEYVEKCKIELVRFELITDLSGYPELSLLSQWSQSNLDIHAKKKNKKFKKFKKFIDSNEIWSWVEHVGECLRESDDMSHMSSLSVELMREDWLKAIKMEDLQSVLLALRHLEDTGTTETNEVEVTEENENEVISWDKDVHPELLAVYFQETPDQIDHVAGLLHKISRGESSIAENKEAARIAHTIKGSSGVVGLNSLLDLTHHLEDILDYSVNNEITPETADLLSEASDCMESLFETIQNKQAPPEELPSVLERLSSYSGKLSPANKGVPEGFYEDKIDDEDETAISETTTQSNNTKTAPVTKTVKPITEKSSSSSIDTTEAFIRVPIKVIDKLLNLAGELVTTSNQVSDNLAKTKETNKTIRTQDERVLSMLDDLNKTIDQQEKDQHNLFSSMDNTDFDSLEMDTYNELNSVVSLLSEGILDSQEIDNTLTSQLDELSEKLHSLDKLNKTFSDVILSSRMVTIDTIVPRLERIVRQTSRKTNKKARLVVKGNNLNVDTDILNNLVDPLLHMLRNSIDHGIELPEERVKNDKDETGLIELEFSRDGNNILMTLSDDGAGINPEKIQEKAVEKGIITSDEEFSDSDAIKLILQAGFSTQENVTDISGRGVGMDVVNTSIQDLNGTMGIESDFGKGTSFNLTIPLTLITNTTLLVKVEDNLLAIPTDTIEQIMYQQADTLIQRDGNYYVTYADEELKTTSLGELLHWPHQMIDVTKSYNILIIKTDDQTHAIHVDDIESSREVVVKRLSPWISPAKGVIGACHLNDGGVAPVINLVTVAKEVEENAKSSTNKTAPIQIIRPNVKKQILVVDDSLSNRKALSLIIDRTDYDVITAVDGLDALRVMNENPIDLVFTDLEMPRMNGLELTQSIRAWNDKSALPIVMITSRTTNKHRELAKKAGVDDYLTKPVETETLLQSIDTWLELEEPVEA